MLLELVLNQERARAGGPRRLHLRAHAAVQALPGAGAGAAEIAVATALAGAKWQWQVAAAVADDLPAAHEGDASQAALHLRLALRQGALLSTSEHHVAERCMPARASGPRPNCLGLRA